MTRNHSCPTCGHRHSTRSWADRHPAAAVIAGLFTLSWVATMFSDHPIAATAMTAVAGIAGAAYLTDRERDRRAALAARAEHDYRQLLAAPLPALQPPPQPPAHTLPWQLASRLETEPLPRRNHR